MAKLSAHGRELWRVELMNCREAWFEDGVVLRNHGNGWKVHGRVKKGLDVHAAVNQVREAFERGDERVPERAWFRRLLVEAVSLERRSFLYETIRLMPGDPDGVWATADDHHWGLTVEDCNELCTAYAAMRRAWKEGQRATQDTAIEANPA